MLKIGIFGAGAIGGHIAGHLAKKGECEVKHDSAVALTEPSFAPRYDGAAEEDGYLMVPEIYKQDHVSDLRIFDTQGITTGPIDTMKVPFQIG